MEVLYHTLADTLAVMPLLFALYVLLGFLEQRLACGNTLPFLSTKAGPLIGALCGSIPQCGFSAASAELFHYGAIGLGTLIAVFLATSDEALFILLTYPNQQNTIIALFISKILLAIFWGYLITLLIPQKYQSLPQKHHHTIPCTNHHHHSLFTAAFQHSLKIVLFLFAALFVINLLTTQIGTETLARLFWRDTPYQPFITAFLGLIPGCSTSILLTTLYLEGVLTFGAVIAGLSTSCGFGYLILLKHFGWRILPIVLITYLAAALSGIFLEILRY